MASKFVNFSKDKRLNAAFPDLFTIAVMLAMVRDGLQGWTLTKPAA